jgi:regulator of sirC expression with transglutaminase-like and TPR domain
MDFPLGRKYFYREIQQPDEQISLERAALYLALEEYPNLDVEAYLNALDTMAAEVEVGLPARFYPLRILQSINQYLYEHLAFKGNASNYYDPDNSFLNQVIDRRTGIPITLALVYLAIARRINFPMVGIGMPGHFLIRPTVDEMEIFVDAFHQGEILFLQDCQDRLAQVFGQPVPFQAEFLRPVTNRQFLARMLTNLKVIYINRGDGPRALAAIDRILLLFPQSATELRDRGLVHFQLNQLTQAQQDLEAYLTMAPDADDAATIQQLLDQMK